MKFEVCANNIFLVKQIDDAILSVFLFHIESDDFFETFYFIWKVKILPITLWGTQIEVWSVRKQCVASATNWWCHFVSTYCLKFGIKMYFTFKFMLYENLLILLGQIKKPKFIPKDILFSYDERRASKYNDIEKSCDNNRKTNIKMKQY